MSCYLTILCRLIQIVIAKVDFYNFSTTAAACPSNRPNYAYLWFKANYSRCHDAKRSHFKYLSYLAFKFLQYLIFFYIYVSFVFQFFVLEVRSKEFIKSSCYIVKIYLQYNMHEIRPTLGMIYLVN